MKLHFFGGVGRVHALIWKVLQSARVTAAYCAPGNAGIAGEKLLNGTDVICFPVDAKDLPGQLALARDQKPALVICCEDDPLGAGVVDLFQENGFRIWGPTRSATRMESSKVFSAAFMERHGIPTPYGEAFASHDEALAFAEEELDWCCAVKVDGLALGKGAIVCRNRDETEDALDRIFVDREFGAAGNSVLIQELVTGNEVSLHYLCNGKSAVAFDSSKDHKPVGDDGGPNTGGMGAISPSPDISEEKHQWLSRQIITPWLKGCRKENIDFRGILYPGIMMTPKGPVVLEFNARFGDPETQVYMTRLENDLLELIEASLEGRQLAPDELRFRKVVSICIVVAMPGYPGSYAKGKLITGLDTVATWPNVKVFHAGTKRGDNGRIYTNGGRVLGVTAWAENLAVARLLAYRAVKVITFEGGQHFRRNIGGPPLKL